MHYRPVQVASITEETTPCLTMVRKKGGQSDPGGGSSSSPALNDRTLPEWLDSKGEHGPVTVLLMAPAHREGKLPNNPFVIAKSVKEQVGSISAAYRDKDGHLVVKVRCAKKAAKLLQMQELIDGTKVTVTEHTRLNQARCIATCHTVEELSEEELTKELADQGVIGVHRLGRKGGKSATMVITLRGTVVPKEIFFGFDRCATRPYKQSPMQCFRCFGYGHTKARCSAEHELCRNCSKAHTIEKDSDGKTICTAAASCMHCNGAHSPTSRTCPKYAEEEEINEIRIKEDKSAREARRLFLERKTTSDSSYAAAAASGNSDVRRNENLKKELEETKNTLKKALNEIANFKQARAAERKQDQENQQALKKALAQIAKLKTAAQTNRPNPANPNSGNDSDMEIVEIVEESNKRRHPELSPSESSGDDDEEDDDDNDDDDSEDSQANAPAAPIKAANESVPAAPIKAASEALKQKQKPAAEVNPKSKPTNPKGKPNPNIKKPKLGSGQVDSAPNNSKNSRKQ